MLADMNLMLTKREKFRIEIRKSHQTQELETKRFFSVKKTALENKENVLFNIFSSQEIMKPIDLFNHLEQSHNNGDMEQLQQSVITLSRFIDNWDETFRKEFFMNQIPKKLIEIIADKANKKIVEEITGIFFTITGGSFDELKIYTDGLVIIYEQLLNNENYNINTLNNIIFGISNICFDSTDFSHKVLETKILQRISNIYHKQENSYLMKESLINLLINLLENLKNPGEVKHSQVKDLFNIIRCLIHDFIYPSDDPKDAKLKDNCIRTAEALSVMTNTFHPLMVFEVMDEEFQFFVFLLDILEKIDKKMVKFICPCLDFITDIVSIECLETSMFFKCGLLEIIDDLLDKSSGDIVNKKALQVLSNIPYETCENDIFSMFKGKFEDILKGPISESKKELIITLNEIFANCNPNDKEILGFLNDKEILHKIIECLEIEDIKAKKHGLELLESILIIGMNEMARLSLTGNPFAINVTKDSGFKNIENLQNNPNEELSAFANKLMDNYLENL